jgi:hypothetical protein
MELGCLKGIRLFSVFVIVLLCARATVIVFVANAQDLSNRRLSQKLNEGEWVCYSIYNASGTVLVLTTTMNVSITAIKDQNSYEYNITYTQVNGPVSYSSGESNVTLLFAANFGTIIAENLTVGDPILFYGGVYYNITSSEIENVLGNQRTVNVANINSSITGETVYEFDRETGIMISANTTIYGQTADTLFASTNIDLSVVPEYLSPPLLLFITITFAMVLLTKASRLTHIKGFAKTRYTGY